MENNTWEKLMEGITEDAVLTEAYLLYLANRIGLLMQRRGMSQKELAAAIGMKQSQLSAILNCDLRNMTLKTIARFEAFFGEEIIRIPGSRYPERKAALRVARRQPQHRTANKRAAYIAEEQRISVVQEETPAIYTTARKPDEPDIQLLGIETLRFNLTVNPGFNGDEEEGSFYFWVSAEVYDGGLEAKITIELVFNTEEEVFAVSPYKLETTLRFTYFLGGAFARGVPSWKIRALAADALHGSRGVVFSLIRAMGHKPIIMPPVKEAEIEVE